MTLSDFNAALHESSIYNIAQTTIASVAVFTGGMNSGFNKAANSAGVKPSCFVAVTLVMAVAGMVAIEKIKSGDKVISTDPETMETSPKTVLETYIRQVDKLVHLTINGEEIVTTDNHPFYIQGRDLIEAGNLLVGDKLISVNGEVLFVKKHQVEELDEPVDVYNFKVEDYHTYFVGDCTVWVHNKNCPSYMNEDGTLKPKQKYTTGENGYTYKTDSNGNVSSAHADKLKLKTHNGRLNHKSNTPGKLSGDDAGHLFADQFGGFPDLDNLLSQRSDLNRAIKNHR